MKTKATVGIIIHLEIPKEMEGDLTFSFRNGAVTIYDPEKELIRADIYTHKGDNE